MSEDEYLGRADRFHRDWHGEVSAEDDIVNGRTLYEVAGLDRDTWTILAVDFFTSGRWRDKEDVYIYALNTGETGVGNHSDLMALADREGSLPVTSFLLHDVKLADVVEGLKSLRVQMRHRGVIDRELRIVDRGDVPPQD